MDLLQTPVRLRNSAQRYTPLEILTIITISIEDILILSHSLFSTSTRGASQSLAQLLTLIYGQLKDEGINLIVLQITDDYRKDELESYVPAPICDHLSYVPKFADLTDLQQLVDEKICDSQYNIGIIMLFCIIL